MRLRVQGRQGEACPGRDIRKRRPCACGWLLVTGRREPGGAGQTLTWAVALSPGYCMTWRLCNSCLSFPICLMLTMNKDRAWAQGLGMGDRLPRGALSGT